MEILTGKERGEIISRSIYWDEITKRDHPSTILQDELIGIVHLLGAKVLWVLKDYAGGARNHTATDAHNLAQNMWTQKMGDEDCFDFVRRLLDELYRLSKTASKRRDDE